MAVFVNQYDVTNPNDTVPPTTTNSSNVTPSILSTRLSGKIITKFNVYDMGVDVPFVELYLTDGSQLRIYNENVGIKMYVSFMKKK
jgi:hypothetical protein